MVFAEAQLALSKLRDGALTINTRAVATIRRLSRAITGILCVATAGCSKAAPPWQIADDLDSLSALATRCDSMPPGAAWKPDGTMLFVSVMSRLPTTTRLVSIGVDSQKRLRHFTTFVSGPRSKLGRLADTDTIQRSQTVRASFDSTGRMSDARRSFETDLVSGDRDSSSFALSRMDTARVRGLASEVKRRCAR
jgi:hypothetical protein